MRACLRFAFLLLLCNPRVSTLPALAQPVVEDAQQLSQPVSEDAFRVRHFTTVDGLPHNSIFALLEDHLGFLWISAGTGGLVRYDGYAFTPFRPREGDSSGIGMHFFSVLHEDAAGNLWAGGHPQLPMGVSRFDRRTERFTRYRHDPNDPNTLVHDGVTAIYSSPHEPGVVWISGHSNDPNHLLGGLGRLDVETGLFTNYPLDPANPATFPYFAHTIIDDREGTRWWGGWGINRFDPTMETVTTFLPDSTVSFDSPNYINNVDVIYEAPLAPGVLWVGTWRGLYRFDRETEAFTPFLPYSGDPRDTRNRVNTVLEDRTGVLWVGTGGGLFTFDRAAGRFTRFAHPLASSSILSMIEDRFGVLWIGLADGGLLKLERRANPFHVYAYNPAAPPLNVGIAVTTDREGALWIAKPDTLKRIDRRTGEVATYIHDPGDSTSLAPALPMNLYEDRTGTLWVPGACTSDNRGNWLSRMDRRTGRFTRYRYHHENSLSAGCVNAVLEDRNGAFWVITWGGGLNRMDRQSGHFTCYRHDPDDPNSLVNDYVLGIYEDPDGLLWLGTEDGLSRFDPSAWLRAGPSAGTGRTPATESPGAGPGYAFTNYRDDRLRRVMMMHQDHAGRFWLATAGNGLHRFDPETGTIAETFTVEDGLPSNILYAVYEDAQGFLWLSTDNGLFRFDPETRAILIYTTRDGLPFDAFLEAAHHQSPQGELFFGGSQGVVSFFPDQVERNPVPPEVVLTGFRIGGLPAAIGPDEPLKASITMTRAVTLSHGQNELTFDYVGLHSIAPPQNRYRYRLEEYDTDWVDAGTQRTARYPRLPPGDYTFRVTAASGDGIWTQKEASVRVTILPPWWRTWWVYALYGLLLVGGVFAVDRFQRRRLIARERQRAELQHERLRAEAAERELEQAREIERAYHELRQAKDRLVQQEKLASLGALTAGIAHEIKNPLNFINNFAEVNEELADELREALHNGNDVEALLADLKQNAQVIAQHGKRADGIVHAMMQHASGGLGQREPTNLNALVAEYVGLAYHGKRAQRTGFSTTIERDLDEEVRAVELVPQEIGRVLLNLLSNAFDAVHERAGQENGTYEPTVTVSTRRDGDHVTIRVGDNGVGIPREARERIFEPFYTTKPTGSGTGLGLSLAYDIVVQGHGGTLVVESEAGKGAAFILTLPA